MLDLVCCFEADLDPASGRRDRMVFLPWERWGPWPSSLSWAWKHRPWPWEL